MSYLRSPTAACCVGILSVGLLLAFSANSTAAELKTADGRTIDGRLLLSEDGVLTVLPPLDEDSETDNEDNAPRLTVDLMDMDQALFGAVSAVGPGQALIQLPGRHTSNTASASMNLRAGLHRLVLVYWQGPGDADLDLQWSGPDMPRGPIPSERLKRPRNSEDASIPSPGMDAEGFRLPDQPGDTRSRLTYTYYTIDSDNINDDDTHQWNMAEPFGLAEKKRAGSSSKIDLRLAGRASYYCLVFDGYVEVPTDGTYEFFLRSDDGSALFLGPPPDYVQNAGSMIDDSAAPLDKDAWQPMDPKAWRVELAGDDQLPATGIARWTDEAIAFQAPIGDDKFLALDIPHAYTRALWPNLPGGATIDRSDEPTNADSVYVRTDGQEVRRVSGVVLSLETQATDDDGEPRLTLQYEGEPRRIKLSRVAGIVLRHHPEPVADPTAVRQRLVLKNAACLTGHWTTADGQALTYITDWGQTLQVEAEDVGRIVNLNGRLVRLTQLTPSAVEQTPYFDRMLPHRINTSLSGEAIRLFDNVTYTQGISVHAHNRLTYDIDGRFGTFRSKVGLLNPNGEMGDVDIRVLADDGRVVFERSGLTASDEAVEIDVDVTGVNRLILETDFGQGQDVGDRVAWVEPTLLRKSD